MSVTAQFQDRYEAGRLLAAKLSQYASSPDVVVLGLAPGGVPVGFEVARALGAPLDVFLVHKLEVPGYDELAMGAIASGGVRALNREVIHRLGLSASILEAIAQEREKELRQRESVYRPWPATAIETRTAILVNDGIATGTRVRAALEALRRKHPKRIVVASPIGSPDTCRQLREEVSDLVCVQTPEPYYTTGTWYADFMDVPDEEITRLIRQIATEREARRSEAGLDRRSISEDIMA